MSEQANIRYRCPECETHALGDHMHYRNGYPHCKRHGCSFVAGEWAYLCEKCGLFAAVMYGKNEDVHSVVNRMEAHHGENSPNCQAGSLSFRTVSPECVKEAMVFLEPR